MALDKRIYVIYNLEDYDKDIILEDMKEEGFNHYFKMFCDVPEGMSGIFIKEADEIWVFGDVEDILDYKLALEMGSEIWRMD